MKTFLKYMPNISIIIATILSGFIISLIVFSFILNYTIFDSSFHLKNFKKNNIHTHIENVILTSINDFFEDLKKFPMQNKDEQKEIISMLEKSINKKMIKENIDNIIDGTFKYISAKRIFLPDISFTLPKDNDSNQPIIGQISKIQKINLSTVLVYLNRTDIQNYLLNLKFFYHLNEYSFIFLIYIFFLICIILLLFLKNYLNVIKFIANSILSSSFIVLVLTLILYIFLNKTMSSTVNYLSMSIPLEKDLIAKYFSYLINNFLLCFCIYGVLAIVVSLFILISLNYKNVPNYLICVSRKQTYIRYLICGCIFTVIAISFTNSTIKFKEIYKDNNFSKALNNILEKNTKTQVILAKNQTIYSLEVKIIDKKTSLPIQNVKTYINGKGNETNVGFFKEQFSDIDGNCKFLLDKGAFRISFLESSLPEKYQLPSPYFIELKNPGTTIVTLELTYKDELNNKKLGVVEIEVLDKNNATVSNLELSIMGNLKSSEKNIIRSVTNSEGIAIFKLDEGIYKVGFSNEKFPKNYKFPPVFDITVKEGNVIRYGYKLSSY